MSAISRKLQTKIRLQAKDHCGYCLLPQNLNPTLLEIERIRPVADGETDAEENLWLACRECNSHKAVKTSGFDSKSGRLTKISTRESKIGTGISNSTKTTLKLSAKRFAAERRSKP